MLRKLNLVPLLLILPFQAIASDEDAQRLKASTDVLDEMAAGDKGVPGSLFGKAKCAVVIPNMKKAGFVFTGKYGRGYASCRAPGGGWTGPAATRIEGGGFGLQAGGSESDIVMLVMSEKGMKGLLTSKFTMGGETSVAAGPVGRDLTAQTDATLKADILSWSRSKGVFGGISLQGGTLRPDDDDVNKTLYGQKESNPDILSGKVKPPAVSTPFISALVKYGGHTESK